ncbi:DUF3099 domain-containing protein [Corynebacterium sp. TAE3-ERU12]|uniref:DUF3099 domain-containing protein n=1 Tax=Corynebacterium sp. TAE3-ERU12 TaxID=2849491 RepID=UPI0021054547|nr:DUF3099 domain-containing protein [Corynebacterium sp. TAE3-ERU12]
MARLRRKNRRDTALITDARTSPQRNYNQRRHTYTLLQLSRIPLLLLAGAAIMWWDLPWLAAVLTVVSVPMPWIAVVIANGVGEPADRRAPRVYKPAAARAEAARWAAAQQNQLAGGSLGALPAAEQPLSDADGDADADDSIVIDMPTDDAPNEDTDDSTDDGKTE